MRKTISIAAIALLAAGLATALPAQNLEDQLNKALKDIFPPSQQKKEEAKKPQQAQQPGGAASQQPAAAKESGFSIPPIGSIPLEDEVKIGRQIAGNLLGAAPLVKDPKLQQYVNEVGRWVAGQSGRPDLKWTFGVIESTDINAFAAPGGYVFVTRGLYARFKDEAELAGVLAHEVAHVQQKHHLKVLQQQQLIGLGSQLLGKQVGGDQAVQRLIGSGAEIMARGLDKSAEFEADRIGVVLATRAGYDPWGLPTVLQDIGSVSKSDSGVALLFKTHPHPDERLAALSEAMGERFDGVTGSRNLTERLYRIK